METIHYILIISKQFLNYKSILINNNKNRKLFMNKKILAVIVVIIVAIIAAVALMGGDSADEVFKFSDYTVTCPAGSDYEEDGNIVKIITSDYDKPAVTIIKYNMTGAQFDELVAAKDMLGDEQLLSFFNQGADAVDNSSDVKINSFNVTKFGNYSAVELSLTEGTDTYIYHIIKVSDSKVFWVVEDASNEDANKIFNSIKFTA